MGTEEDEEDEDDKDYLTWGFFGGIYCGVKFYSGVKYGFFPKNWFTFYDNDVTRKGSNGINMVLFLKKNQIKPSIKNPR